jgi:hypothetical protein
LISETLSTVELGKKMASYLAVDENIKVNAQCNLAILISKIKYIVLENRMVYLSV